MNDANVHYHKHIHGINQLSELSSMAMEAAKMERRDLKRDVRRDVSDALTSLSST